MYLKILIKEDAESVDNLLRDRHHGIKLKHKNSLFVAKFLNYN